MNDGLGSLELIKLKTAFISLYNANPTLSDGKLIDKINSNLTLKKHFNFLLTLKSQGLLKNLFEKHEISKKAPPNVDPTEWDQFCQKLIAELAKDEPEYSSDKASSFRDTKVNVGRLFDELDSELEKENNKNFADGIPKDYTISKVFLVLGVTAVGIAALSLAVGKIAAGGTAISTFCPPLIPIATIIAAIAVVLLAIALMAAGIEYAFKTCVQPASSSPRLGIN